MSFDCENEDLQEVKAHAATPRRGLRESIQKFGGASSPVKMMEELKHLQAERKQQSPKLSPEKCNTLLAEDELSPKEEQPCRVRAWTFDDLSGNPRDKQKMELEHILSDSKSKGVSFEERVTILQENEGVKKINLGEYPEDNENDAIEKQKLQLQQQPQYYSESAGGSNRSSSNSNSSRLWMSQSPQQNQLNFLHKQVKGVLEMEGYYVEEGLLGLSPVMQAQLLKQQQSEIVRLASMEYLHSQSQIVTENRMPSNHSISSSAEAEGDTNLQWSIGEKDRTPLSCSSYDQSDRPTKRNKALRFSLGRGNSLDEVVLKEISPKSVHQNYENFKATKQANQTVGSTKEQNYLRESDEVEWGNKLDIVKENQIGSNSNYNNNNPEEKDNQHDQTQKSEQSSLKLSTPQAKQDKKNSLRLSFQEANDDDEDKEDNQQQYQEDQITNLPNSGGDSKRNKGLRASVGWAKFQDNVIERKNSDDDIDIEIINNSPTNSNKTISSILSNRSIKSSCSEDGKSDKDQFSNYCDRQNTKDLAVTAARDGSESCFSKFRSYKKQVSFDTKLPILEYSDQEDVEIDAEEEENQSEQSDSSDRDPREMRKINPNRLNKRIYAQTTKFIDQRGNNSSFLTAQGDDEGRENQKNIENGSNTIILNNQQYPLLKVTPPQDTATPTEQSLNENTNTNDNVSERFETNKLVNISQAENNNYGDGINNNRTNNNCNVAFFESEQQDQVMKKCLFQEEPKNNIANSNIDVQAPQEQQLFYLQEENKSIKQSEFKDLVPSQKNNNNNTEWNAAMTTTSDRHFSAVSQIPPYAAYSIHQISSPLSGNTPIPILNAFNIENIKINSLDLRNIFENNQCENKGNIIPIPTQEQLPLASSEKDKINLKCNNNVEKQSTSYYQVGAVEIGIIPTVTINSNPIELPASFNCYEDLSQLKSQQNCSDSQKKQDGVSPLFIPISFPNVQINEMAAQLTPANNNNITSSNISSFSSKLPIYENIKQQYSQIYSIATPHPSCLTSVSFDQKTHEKKEHQQDINKEASNSGREYDCNGNLAYEGELRDGIRQGNGIQYNSIWSLGNSSKDSEQVDPSSICFSLIDYYNLSVIPSSSWIQYRGSFSKGMRVGFGKLTMEQGQSYEGYFADDIPHGYGYFITPQGETIKGFWKKGIYQHCQHS